MFRTGLTWTAALLVFPMAAVAMDLPHYNLDSLTYLSTDIVTARITVETQQHFTARVDSVLYGKLQVGDTLDTLSPFLQFFQPMSSGQPVILFLDSRRHPRDFLYPELEKSPFAVVLSGVYFIDEYEHLHEYFQPMNPGGRVIAKDENIRGCFVFLKNRPRDPDDVAAWKLNAGAERICPHNHNESLRVKRTRKTPK